VAILTSNRTRELHDALKRRCFYHWIDYPPLERAAAIVRRRVPGGSEPVVTAATASVSRARDLDLDKPPGLTESIDWVSALHTLGVSNVDRAAMTATIGAIAKTPDDLATIRAHFADDPHVP
jgi:MoxR-like ATPase